MGKDFRYRVCYREIFPQRTTFKEQKQSCKVLLSLTFHQEAGAMLLIGWCKDRWKTCTNWGVKRELQMRATRQSSSKNSPWHSAPSSHSALSVWQVWLYNDNRSLASKPLKLKWVGEREKKLLRFQPCLTNTTHLRSWRQPPSFLQLSFWAQVDVVRQYKEFHRNTSYRVAVPQM